MRGFLLGLAALTLAAPAEAGRRYRGVPLPYPELLAPGEPLMLPEGFSLTQTGADAGESGLIDRPRDISGRLARCWRPSANAVEVSVKLSFRRDGSVIGQPFVTFVRAPAGLDRETVGHQIRQAIILCTPLPFTPRLGAAIAGRLFLIRFISNQPRAKDADT